MQQYRFGGIETAIVEEARTAYGIALDTSSWEALALTAGPVWVFYMLAPFVWQVTNALDLFAAMEALLRAALIVAAVAAWVRARGIAAMRSSCFSISR